MTVIWQPSGDLWSMRCRPPWWMPCSARIHPDLVSAASRPPKQGVSRRRTDAFRSRSRPLETTKRGLSRQQTETSRDNERLPLEATNGSLSHQPMEAPKQKNLKASNGGLSRHRTESSRGDERRPRRTEASWGFVAATNG